MVTIINKNNKRLKGEFRNCLTCNEEFYALPGSIKRGWGESCSQKCRPQNQNATYRLGKYAEPGNLPATHFKATGLTFKGTRSEYKHLHYWVNKQLGKATSCATCGSNNWVEWANKSGEYKYDLSDWIELCKKCHFKYDKQYLRMEVNYA